MRLTTKGRYAVQAMADIAAAKGDGPVSLPDIAERQGISAGYLEQLFAKLRRAGLVMSVRGVAGGYRLGRAAAAHEEVGDHRPVGALGLELEGLEGRGVEARGQALERARRGAGTRHEGQRVGHEEGLEGDE